MRKIKNDFQIKLQNVPHFGSNREKPWHATKQTVYFGQLETKQEGYTRLLVEVPTCLLKEGDLDIALPHHQLHKLVLLNAGPELVTVIVHVHILQDAKGLVSFMYC